MSVIQDYYYKIRTCLARMWAEIYIDGGSNLQDSKVFCENIVRDLLNITYDWSLNNGNEVTFNNGGFDLVDEEHSIIIQVSAQTDKAKVDHSIEKSDKDVYQGYRFIFFGLELKPFPTPESNYLVPEKITFDSSNDRWNIKSFSEYVQTLSNDLSRVKRIAEYLETQYGTVKKWQKPLVPKNAKNGIKLLDFIYAGEKYSESDKEDNLKDCEELFNRLNNVEIKHRNVFKEIFEKGEIARKEEKGLKINHSIVDGILDRYGIDDHFEFMNTLSDKELCSDPAYLDDEDPAFYLYESNGFFIQNLKRYSKQNRLNINELFCDLNFELLDE